MFDSHGRCIRYLRISVTDRCNLRCIYCMSERRICLSDLEHILTYEEIERVVRIATSLEIGFIRLTGGEPLVRREVCSLVKRLSRIPGLTDLSLTTNGTLLEPLASSLQKAGLKRVNISLDTLDEGRFSCLTRGGDLSCVRAGIYAALNAGLEPVKINVVLFADENGEPPENDILGFAEMSRNLPLHVRFIEWMPAFGEYQHNGGDGRDAMKPLSENWAKKVLSRLGKLYPYSGPVSGGPARYFRYAGAAGSIGFIAPLSAPFCGECSRLRLTSTGKLRSCLLHDGEVDLRRPMRNGATDAEIVALFLRAAQQKPASYSPEAASSASMSWIGG
ncbi:MAG: GTP 3',8-cyclase MoaA [Armatimonadetes bacterium]|nr:GTP 3',8-cyclase MoaA [Armatimonadota bacterium]NIM24673.1 GTP 3',8-cyclase MoaA [Armatimonadota bacterium]NIM68552.1 GTP 3',8-cyclase MoaA [Armatimonadota bacterium]NIM76932.1 GTP 3',8-cyclase MoaA [Armatimonadota bacterium]NIN06746.1 GTP 3',8-cyclase MoaA [Armatimonadota bacterium]